MDWESSGLLEGLSEEYKRVVEDLYDSMINVILSEQIYIPTVRTPYEAINALREANNGNGYDLTTLALPAVRRIYCQYNHRFNIRDLWMAIKTILPEILNESKSSNYDNPPHVNIDWEAEALAVFCDEYVEHLKQIDDDNR